MKQKDHFAIIWTLGIWLCSAAIAGAGHGVRILIKNQIKEASAASDRQNADLAGMHQQSLLPDADTEKQNKIVALTFDDGPHPASTPKLLDGLASRGVQAAFFVIGSNIPGNESIIKRMDQEGHLIGNHTYDHVKICSLSEKEACVQIEKTNHILYDITGKTPEFVRPPFGAWKKEMEYSFSMIPVLWDVDPLDWTTKNTHQIVQRVLAEVKNGSIILLHDCYDSSVEAAFQIIDELQKQDYMFVTVDQMILE